MLRNWAYKQKTFARPGITRAVMQSTTSLIVRLRSECITAHGGTCRATGVDIRDRGRLPVPPTCTHLL